MSELRKQLDAARDEYLSLRYPGNLADELLKPARPRRGWMWAPILGAVAAAAVVAIALWPGGSVPSGNSTGTELAVVTTAPGEAEAIEVSLADLPVISAPQFNSEIDIAPTSPGFESFATPDFTFTMPAFSYIGGDEQQTDEETVL